MQKTKKSMYCNKNYIMAHDELRHIFRCNMEKVDIKKNHLVMKPSGGYFKIEEFCPPETSFKGTKEIMLCSKFENLYQDRFRNREVNKA